MSSAVRQTPETATESAYASSAPSEMNETQEAAAEQESDDELECHGAVAELGGRSAGDLVVELRADNRSDLFSLGTVLFEMLTSERLFQGKTTAEVLEQVIAGHHPSPRTFNPAIPDGVMAIVRTALQRDATRRYASAGEMGAACEHFLYDKGYGPTNLTLKQYLHALFPEFKPPRPVTRDEFPLVEPTLIPISDAPSSRRDGKEDDKTPVAPLNRAYNVAVPPPDAPPTLAPGPAGPRPRRLKTRLRPR